MPFLILLNIHEKLNRSPLLLSLVKIFMCLIKHTCFDSDCHHSWRIQFSGNSWRKMTMRKRRRNRDRRMWEEEECGTTMKWQQWERKHEEERVGRSRTTVVKTLSRKHRRRRRSNWLTRRERLKQREEIVKSMTKGTRIIRSWGNLRENRRVTRRIRRRKKEKSKKYKKIHKIQIWRRRGSWRQRWMRRRRAKSRYKNKSKLLTRTHNNDFRGGKIWRWTLYENDEKLFGKKQIVEDRGREGDTIKIHVEETEDISRVWWNWCI